MLSEVGSRSRFSNLYSSADQSQEFGMSRALIAPTILLASVLVVPGGHAETWPTLPRTNAEVEIPAQEWPLHPGPRTVKFSIFYPGGSLEGVTPDTGLFLTLHNWGGMKADGTADP